MVKLIQDLTAFGPLLFIVVLIAATGFAVWLIMELQFFRNSATGQARDRFLNLRRNSWRMKSLRPF
jgi:hypothetical protein